MLKKDARRTYSIKFIPKLCSKWIFFLILKEAKKNYKSKFLKLSATDLLFSVGNEVWIGILV